MSELALPPGAGTQREIPMPPERDFVAPVGLGGATKNPDGSIHLTFLVHPLKMLTIEIAAEMAPGFLQSVNGGVVRV